MKLKLIKKEEEAKDTKSFYFEPEIPVKWLPGQFFYFTLPKLKYPDSRGNTHLFTISLSPTEANYLRLTTRLRRDSGYKQSLDQLPIGSFIEGEGPNGTFILDENEKGNHVLIAGGIGITPFRTFIKYNIDKGLKDTNLFLIYSNSTPEEIAFRQELESWDKKYENIKVAMTVTHPEKSKEKWTGLVGRIDEKMIQSIVTNQLPLKQITFWLCGPPQMVEAIEKLLGFMKVTSDKIRSEKFTGY